MREIMFRGKRVGGGEWVVGTLVKMGPVGYVRHFILPDYASAFYDIEVDSATVGQYTGLTDKNGVMIFEGDVVLVDEYKRYVVKFSLERMGYEPFATGDGCGCCEVDTVRYEYQSIEVIGNIYDTPELLSKEGSQC